MRTFAIYTLKNKIQQTHSDLVICCPDMITNVDDLRTMQINVELESLFNILYSRVVANVTMFNLKKLSNRK